MESDIEYLFVYGTLRKGVELPINKQISNYLEWIGLSEIKGKLFDIGAYPGAKESDGDADISFIKGDVFKILEIQVLDILDEYEGFNSKNFVESDYLRKQAIVNLEGKEVIVWIYWYNKPINNKFRIQHKDYLEYLKTKKTA